MLCRVEEGGLPSTKEGTALFYAQITRVDARNNFTLGERWRRRNTVLPVNQLGARIITRISGDSEKRFEAKSMSHVPAHNLMR